MRRLVCKYCLRQEIYPLRDRAGHWIVVKADPAPFEYGPDTANTDGWVLFVNRDKQGLVVHLRDLSDFTLRTVREILVPHYCPERQKQLYERRLDRQLAGMNISERDLADFAAGTRKRRSP